MTGPAEESTPEGGVGRRTVPRELLAPRLARGIAVMALLCYSTITMLNVVASWKFSPTVAASLVCVAVIFTLQFMITSPRSAQWPTDRRIVALVTQLLLTYVPFIWFGLNWGAMEGPMGASLLLLLPGRLAWPAFAVLLAAIPVYSMLAGTQPAEAAYFTVSALLCSILLYGLSKLSEMVQELHDAKEQLARMAVSQERLRFARDLHDLLGYSLSAVTLKGELANRLITRHPDRAQEEIQALLVVARQALADVRMVASGYRQMSLRDEAQAVAAVLSAAGVRAEVALDHGRLHPMIDTVLATALREGVTNVLRHSRVRFCSISATGEGESIRLVLVNDGVTHALDSHPSRDGSGLDNLRTRCHAVGGRLRAGVREDGRFQLEAWVPEKPREPAASVPQPGGGPRPVQPLHTE
ncbi:sensor histidine kinase [Streptomyces sp. NPDC051561]|uniref:sensor histidine kinase n=1 Tax=Streptomyces sp. NPDC051561 TaxID=3365658 RepID=UPI00378D113E